MKKILTMIAFVVSMSAMAQNDSIDQCQFAVVYDFQTKTTDRDGNAVTDSAQLAVLVGRRTAKCLEYNRAMMEEFGDTNREYMYGEWDARKYNLPVIFVNHPDGMVCSYDKIVPNRYYVSEPLPDFRWQLQKDTMTIGGYLCKKAVGNYAGREWTAWYAEELAAPYGPWKLRGLPGMVLSAEDSKGIFSFTFAGLVQKTATIREMGKSGYTEMSKDKFVKHRNKTLCSKRYVENPRYYIPDNVYEDMGAVEMWAGGPEPPAEDKVTVIATDMIVPKKVNVYQPLELK